MSIIDKIKLNGTTYDVGKIPDTTLTQAGQAADAEAVGNNLNIARSSAVELNPIAYYRHSSDGLSVVDFAEMPLNSYDYAQFSVYKTALLNANFPLSWSDTDYIAIERRAVGNKSLPVSIIKLHNFTKTESAEMLYFAYSSVEKYRWILPASKHEIDDLRAASKHEIDDLRAANSAYAKNIYKVSTKDGIEVTWTDDRTGVFSGTATENTFFVMTYSTNGVLPDGIKVSDCKRIWVDFEVSDGISTDDIYVEYLRKETTNTEWHGTTNIKSSSYVDLTNNITDVCFRLRVLNGKTINGTVRFGVRTRAKNFELLSEDNVVGLANKILPTGTDLNDVADNRVWVMSSAATYPNDPDSGKLKYLFSFNMMSSLTTCKYQMIFNHCVGSDGVIGWCRSKYNNDWQSWTPIRGGEDYYLFKGTGIGVQPWSQTNLDSMIGNNVYVMSDKYTYTNIPDGFSGVGFLLVMQTGRHTLQLIFQFNGYKMWKRRGDKDGTTWENWGLISGSNTTIENNYDFTTNENTYNVTASPIITTDTNAYLAPSGDTTDRTADIATMLTTYGVCRLGKGDYYVNNLQMPARTSIIGSGYGTNIILSGSSNGYAIRMTDYCTVSDCTIKGGTTNITLSETLGGRHGILWQGDYTESQSSAHPINGMISNVRFFSFNGGGITCIDTGYGTFNSLEVVNVYCNNCNAGINIAYWSEFHKFTNVRTASCYYGCINNGGNNVFTNCDFSTCKVGVLMDNSQSQSPNNSHGSMIGCVFNHTDSNTGIGIKILNCNNGFIFSGCQIFYSQIYIEDSGGILISDTNFGENNCDITVVNGGTVLFANNMHKAAPPITITNNNNVHFVNCYARSGAIVSPS